MDRIKEQIGTLFESAGRKYEALTYSQSRAPNDRTAAELALLTELLAALAPFKEKFNNLKSHDFCTTTVWRRHSH